MKECDKSTAKPGGHLGPFELVEEQETFRVERCRGCGNVVLRRPDRRDKDRADARGRLP